MPITIADAGHGRHEHDRPPAREFAAHDAVHAHAAVPPARRVVDSPLWWSVPQRLACAAMLVIVLWLVIAWAAM